MVWSSSSSSCSPCSQRMSGLVILLVLNPDNERNAPLLLLLLIRTENEWNGPLPPPPPPPPTNEWNGCPVPPPQRMNGSVLLLLSENEWRRNTSPFSENKRRRTIPFSLSDRGGGGPLHSFYARRRPSDRGRGGLSMRGPWGEPRPGGEGCVAKGLAPTPLASPPPLAPWGVGRPRPEAKARGEGYAKARGQGQCQGQRPRPCPLASPLPLAPWG